MRSVLLILGCLWSSQALALSYDFQQAVRYALRHALNIPIQKLQENIDQLNHQNAKAAFLPQLTLSSDHQLSKTQFSPRVWSHNLGVKLEDDFSKYSQNIADYQSTKLDMSIDRLNLTDSQNQQVYQLVQDYLGYSQNIALYRLQKTILDLNQKSYMVATQLYHQGLKPQKDQLNLETSMLSQKITVRDALLQVKESKNQVISDMNVPRSIAKALDLRPLSIQVMGERLAKLSMIPIKTNQLLTHKINQLKMAKDTWAVKQAKLDAWPKVGLSVEGGYGDQAQDGTGFDLNSDKRFHWSTDLSLTYTLFDGGILSRNETIAEQTRLMNEKTGQQNLSKQKLTILNAMNQFKHDKSIMAQAMQSTAVAKSYYHLSQQAYQNGRGTSTDFINSMVTLQSARTNLINLNVDLIKNFYQYHRYKGDILKYVV